MDPATWPIWVKMLVGWGPLGAWAGIMTWLYARKDRTHAAELAARDKRHDAAEVDQAKRFAGVVAASQTDARAREDRIHEHYQTQITQQQAQVIALGEAFAMHTAEADKRHSTQEDQLTERLLNANEKHSETNILMAERVGALAESITRKRGGDDGSQG
jgi:hypothetical protein